MISLVLALVTAVAAQAPADSATASTVIQRPRWVQKPTAHQVEFSYPKAAKHAGWPTGQAAVACDITADGKLEHCEIYQETPQGLGFGEAAQALARHFQMEPLTADGKPVAGGRMVLPIVFRPPRGR